MFNTMLIILLVSYYKDTCIFHNKYMCIAQEGFVCPMCKTALPSPELLQEHYIEAHEQKASENR